MLLVVAPLAEEEQEYPGAHPPELGLNLEQELVLLLYLPHGAGLYACLGTVGHRHRQLYVYEPSLPKSETNKIP